MSKHIDINEAVKARGGWAKVLLKPATWLTAAVTLGVLSCLLRFLAELCRYLAMGAAFVWVVLLFFSLLRKPGSPDDSTDRRE